MDHYIDIRLLPDPEFPETVLMNALFAKLHRRLSEVGQHEIGVSFPDYREDPPRLGARLRLHGTHPALTRMMQTDWLKGMRDLLHLEGPHPVSRIKGYLQVKRVQPKSSPARLRRRLMKRHGLSEAEAHQRIPDTAAQRLALPYITLDSHSTGQRFRLFIRQQARDTAATGHFSQYGLSQDATVPHF